MYVPDLCALLLCLQTDGVGASIPIDEDCRGFVDGTYGFCGLFDKELKMFAHKHGVCIIIHVFVTSKDKDEYSKVTYGDQKSPCLHIALIKDAKHFVQLIPTQSRDDDSGNDEGLSCSSGLSRLSIQSVDLRSDDSSVDEDLLIVKDCRLCIQTKFDELMASMMAKDDNEGLREIEKLRQRADSVPDKTLVIASEQGWFSTHLLADLGLVV